MRANLCENSSIQVNRTKNTIQRNNALQLYLKQLSHHCRHPQRITPETIFTNLAIRPKKTKLLFTFLLRCGSNLSFWPFHVNHNAIVCERIKLQFAMFENTVKMDLTFALFTATCTFPCMIWSINQIVLIYSFVSDFVEITSCVYIKTTILFNLG